jgi:hypothetical protein
MKKEKKFDEELLKKVMYFHGTTTDGFRFTVAGLILGKRQQLDMGISVWDGGKIMFRKSSGRNRATARLLSTGNVNRVGEYTSSLIGSEIVEDDFKVFTVVAAEFNTYTKKELLKAFNLFGEKNKRTSPF